tara:strand:+ start:54809 stop:55003 length:195 start_codon:yes stop_codon:yes gene_type:complete
MFEVRAARRGAKFRIKKRIGRKMLLHFLHSHHRWRSQGIPNAGAGIGANTFGGTKVPPRGSGNT